MIKGIAFDLQFTIVYLEDFTLKRWFDLFDGGFAKVMAYLTDQGISYDKKRLKRILRRMRNKHFTKTITEDQQYFTEEILEDTFSKMDISLQPDVFINCVHLYHSVEIPAWKPFPNALSTLETLSKRYKLALITNAPEYVTQEILKLQKMENLFHFIFTNARKPRLPAFQHFRESINTDYEELVMVGDDIHADIEPSVKLGMKTIHAFRGYEYIQQHAQLKIKPDKKINRFEDVIDAIEELNS